MAWTFFEIVLKNFAVMTVVSRIYLIQVCFDYENNPTARKAVTELIIYVSESIFFHYKESLTQLK